MNFHTFTISIVYFFTIIIVHIVLKNNNNNLERDYNNYEESDYETDYSDNEMVLDIDTIDDLRQQTIERTKGKDNIQNISQEESEEDIKQMEYSLKDMFKPFGEIERLKVLSDKFDRNLTRDIAFLDFVYPTDAEQLLASKERFTIGHNILNLEKSKSRK